MIILQQVSKRYGSRLVVDRVNLTVNRGEILGLVGPNGAGKTTILKMMSTITTPCRGDILVNGKSAIKHPASVRELIGYVPQTITLYDTLTVLDNLKFWGQAAGGGIPAARLRLIAGVVGLQEHLKEKVNRLSGGMQRRLNIAVALLHDPAVLVMDEPTLGIDIKNKNEIVGFIKRLAAEGKTIVYTCHDLYEVKYLCNRVALLNSGKLMFVGTLEEAGRKAGLDPEQDLEGALFRLGKW